MASKDWKHRKNNNPYIPHSWINTKLGQLLEIHFDIGFQKQRNVTVYNYRHQLLSGYEPITTAYCSNEKEAMRKAKSYMRTH